MRIVMLLVVYMPFGWLEVVYRNIQNYHRILVRGQFASNYRYRILLPEESQSAPPKLPTGLSCFQQPIS